MGAQIRPYNACYCLLLFVLSLGVVLGMFGGLWGLKLISTEKWSENKRMRQHVYQNKKTFNTELVVLLYFRILCQFLYFLIESNIGWTTVSFHYFTFNDMLWEKRITIIIHNNKWCPYGPIWAIYFRILPYWYHVLFMFLLKLYMRFHVLINTIY